MASNLVLSFLDYFIYFLYNLIGDFMNKKDYIDIVLKLRETYPEATCSLDFTTPFELVVAVMLSAQCTDERVNKTTPALFKKYKNVSDFAKADLSELEQYIHPCGFYKNKAKNIIACAKKILADYNGTVPNTMEELLTLPGVGRKSANVILLEVFGIAKGIAVDTHCKRISNRIGLSSQTDPTKIEMDLLKKFPREYLKEINHLFVFHGRGLCDARKPQCASCPINCYCKFYNNK